MVFLPRDVDAVFKNSSVTVFSESLNCSFRMSVDSWKLHGWEGSDSGLLRSSQASI